jgi:adenylate kinase family enzyme
MCRIEPVDRVIIAGISGAGKTTLGRTLASRLGMPHYELDALHHGPKWTKRPEFESEVAAFSAGPAWVTEDQYHSALGDLLWQRADTLVWLDLPHPTVMRRVLWRSFLRAATRGELWNGNRESFRNWVEPDHPIRWAWSQYDRKRRQTFERIVRHPHITVIRLSSAGAADRWTRSLRRRHRIH